MRACHIIVNDKFRFPSENLRLTLIFPFANHRLMSIWFVDQSTSSGMCTSEPKYKKHVDHAKKNSFASKLGK